MVHITLHVMEKIQFNYFPIISLGPFSCHNNQTKRQINIILAIFKYPYPSNIPTYIIRNISLLLFWSCRFNVLTDGWTDGLTKKVVTIAHPEHSSDQLNIHLSGYPPYQNIMTRSPWLTKSKLKSICCEERLYSTSIYT